jgi:hypothetical protein
MFVVLFMVYLCLMVPAKNVGLLVAGNASKIVYVCKHLAELVEKCGGAMLLFDNSRWYVGDCNAFHHRHGEGAMYSLDGQFIASGRWQDDKLTELLLWPVKSTAPVMRVEGDLSHGSNAAEVVFTANSAPEDHTSLSRTKIHGPLNSQHLQKVYSIQLSGDQLILTNKAGVPVSVLHINDFTLVLYDSSSLVPYMVLISGMRHEIYQVEVEDVTNLKHTLQQLESFVRDRNYRGSLSVMEVRDNPVYADHLGQAMK